MSTYVGGDSSDTWHERIEEIIYAVRRYHNVGEDPDEGDWHNVDQYYSIVAEEQIPYSDALWRKLALGLFTHGHNQEILEYMHGALERYKHALFAKDIITQLLQKIPDNDIVFLVDIHFYYFIAMLKALGDNLAWILNYFYSMGLESYPSAIDLTKTKFRDKLAIKNRGLFNTICEGSQYEQYRKLREFRDIVVHRHALHVVPVQRGVNGPIKIMVPIDPTRGVMVDDLERRKGAVRYAITSKDKESIAEYGLKKRVVSLVPEEQGGYEDILAFCDRHLRYLAAAYSEASRQLLALADHHP